MLEVNKIYCGDAWQLATQLDNESVDCIVTSPPYWALRSYLKEDNPNKKYEFGREATIKEYIDKLCSLFKILKHKLKKEGTIFVNLGDIYGGTGDKGNYKDPKYSEWRNGQRIAVNKSFTPKCLAMVPERFALGMCDMGFILRNKIIWYKKNSMPSSVKDRLNNKYELIYFFVKNRKYYFDLDSIRKPYKAESIERIKAGFSANVHFNYRVREAVRGNLQQKFGDRYSASQKEIINYKKKHSQLTLDEANTLGEPRAREVRYNSKSHIYSDLNNRVAQARADGAPHDGVFCHPLGGNPGDFFDIPKDCDVWDITTQGHDFCHFAVYPEKLIEPLLKCGCPKDGIVLDPFMGSGTTALVALKQDKKFIGFELNKEYINIAMKRIKPYLEQRKLKEE